MGLERQDIERLYRDCSRPLLMYLTRQTFDPELALDLLSESFVEAFADRRHFRGSSAEEERGWLWGIAKNRLRNSWRRGGIERRALQRMAVEVRPATDQEIERIDELAGLAELRGRVAEQLASLTPEPRQALHLRVVLELSYPEVARQLGVSEQVARARVSRGLRRMAAALQADVPQHHLGSVHQGPT